MPIRFSIRRRAGRCARPLRSLPRVAATILAALLCAKGARAGVPPSAAVEDDQFQRNYLLGDWMGSRTWLWERGLQPKLLLISDPYGNATGGRRQAFATYSMFCADLKVDTEKAFSLPGGVFHVGFATNFGNRLTGGYVGNTFPIQSSDVAPPGPRLTDLSYTQALFADKLSLRAGRVSIDSLYGEEFAASKYFRAFTSVAFNAIPFAIFYNSPGAFGYPATTWGARVKIAPVDRFYAMAGIYNGDPAVGLPDRHGVDFSFHGPPFGIGEIGYRHNQASGDTGLPGNLKLGGFVLGGHIRRYAAEDSSDGRYGLYVVGDQALLRLGPTSENRNVGVFGSLVVAPDEAVSPMTWFFSTGFVTYGPFASRPQDYLSVGMAYGSFSGRLRDERVELHRSDPSVVVPGHEMTIETSYALQLLPGLILQPGLQVIVNPGGRASIPAVLALGLNMVVSL